TAEIETRYRSNVLAIPIQSVTTRLPKSAAADKNKKDKEKKEDKAENSLEMETQKKEKTYKPLEVVFLAENNLVKMVPVTRGISDESYVEILEGVQPGQTIISGGY